MQSMGISEKHGFDRNAALRGTLAAVLAIAVIAALSMVLLRHQDFVDWGFLIGPAAWVIACLAGVRAAGLKWTAGLIGAVVAGVPSGLATLTGFHWLGMVVGLVVFAAWCGSARAKTL